MLQAQPWLQTPGLPRTFQQGFFSNQRQKPTCRGAAMVGPLGLLVNLQSSLGELGCPAKPSRVTVCGTWEVKLWLTNKSQREEAVWLSCQSAGRWDISSFNRPLSCSGCWKSRLAMFIARAEGLFERLSGLPAGCGPPHISLRHGVLYSPLGKPWGGTLSCPLHLQTQENGSCAKTGC